MVLAANALIELDPFKLYVGVPTPESSQNSLLESFINEASQLIENYCNRKFREIEHTERQDGKRSKQILLAQWPVTSITSLHVDNDRVFDATSLIDSSNYEIFTDEKLEGIGLERFDEEFPRGAKNIQIIYKAGYTAYSNVPADLQLACKITGAYHYQIQQNRDFTLSTKNKGDENVTLVQGLPERAINILENYKRLEAY